jgi:hypothetical protein
LGNILEKSSNSNKGARLKKTTREVRGRIRGRETKDEDIDKSFSKLVGYML